MNFSILKAIIGINILGADKDIEWNYLMFAISSSHITLVQRLTEIN